MISYCYNVYYNKKVINLQITLTFDEKAFREAER